MSGIRFAAQRLVFDSGVHTWFAMRLATQRRYSRDETGFRRRPVIRTTDGLAGPVRARGRDRHLWRAPDRAGGSGCCQSIDSSTGRR